jgi:hypothetical protein
MSPEVHSPDEGGNQHALREGRPMRSTHLMREAISMHSGRSTHRARRRRPEQRRRSEAVVPDEGGNQTSSKVHQCQSSQVELYLMREAPRGNQRSSTYCESRSVVAL